MFLCSWKNSCHGSTVKSPWVPDKVLLIETYNVPAKLIWTERFLIFLKRFFQRSFCGNMLKGLELLKQFLGFWQSPSGGDELKSIEFLGSSGGLTSWVLYRNVFKVPQLLKSSYVPNNVPLTKFLNHEKKKFQGLWESSSGVNMKGTHFFLSYWKSSLVPKIRRFLSSWKCSCGVNAPVICILTFLPFYMKFWQFASY